MSKRVGTGKTGWCLGYPPEVQHERCPVVTVSGRRCTCPCHGDTFTHNAGDGTNVPLPNAEENAL